MYYRLILKYELWTGCIMLCMNLCFNVHGGRIVCCVVIYWSLCEVVKCVLSPRQPSSFKCICVNIVIWPHMQNLQLNNKRPLSQSQKTLAKERRHIVVLHFAREDEHKKHKVFWCFAFYLLLWSSWLILVSAVLPKSRGNSKKDEQNTGQVVPKQSKKLFPWQRKRLQLT